MARERLLLISPSFHGYWEPLSAALTARDFEVTALRSDAYDGYWPKTRRKLTVDLPWKLGVDRTPTLTRWATERAVEALRAVRPHRVLVVRGDDLGPSFFEEAERVGAAIGLWLYDEVRRTAHTDDTLRRFDFVATYSALDAAALAERGLPTSYLPLGYDVHCPVHPAPHEEIVFIGARYPERQRLLQVLVAHGVPVHAYGRDWSRRGVDRLRTLSWARPDLPTGPDVDRPHGYGIMAGAIGCLNVHGDQDGFTMRTFEAPGVGGLQLVDRPDVDTLYEPGAEVLVFTSDAELVELAGRARADRRWARAIAEAGQRRTLAEHTLDHRIAELVEPWI